MNRREFFKRTAAAAAVAVAPTLALAKDPEEDPVPQIVKLSTRDPQYMTATEVQLRMKEMEDRLNRELAPVFENIQAQLFKDIEHAMLFGVGSIRV